MGEDLPSLRAHLAALEAEMARARLMPVSKTRFGPGYFYCLDEKLLYIEDLTRRIKKGREALARGEVLPPTS